MANDPETTCCPMCGAEAEPDDPDNYPGWTCGTYRMDNGHLIQEPECYRGEAKKLRRLLGSLLAADERGQGLPWQEAMNAAVAHMKEAANA